LHEGNLYSRKESELFLNLTPSFIYQLPAFFDPTNKINRFMPGA